MPIDARGSMGTNCGMSALYPYRIIKRRPTRQITVGKVLVGGDAPISVQSMTNTPTHDAQATIAQINALAQAGADIVRVSCPDEASTAAFATIAKNSPVPLVADIHFHYQRAIEAAQAGAACLRINPGNIGHADRVRDVVQAAKDYGCSIRIGVNAGSLEKHLLDKYREPCPEAMVESALAHARLLEDNDFFNFKISVKASDVFLTVASYRALAQACDYPLHLGITEAGPVRAGTIKSAMGMGMLLSEGIGDTLRVSLSADPVEEIRVGFDILKGLQLRTRGVNIIACPSCARQGFDVVKTVTILEERLAHITAPITVSVIGCVVNGPGEARSTDIGFTGGNGGAGMLYLNGLQAHKLPNEQLIERLVAEAEAKAKAYDDAAAVAKEG
jgi:(E)-4-hydroxy-3-methylbut-2-enyl-diphosphate synthase